MSVPTIHFEAKKAAYRQSKEGIVVSLVIHPADVPDALATASLGQRYMVAMASIGDDERPEPIDQSTPSLRSDKSALAKERYASVSEREKAVIRAAQYPKGQRFRDYVNGADEYAAAEILRDSIGVRSRAEILTNDAAYRKFLALEDRYKEWAGMMPEMR